MTAAAAGLALAVGGPLMVAMPASAEESSGGLISLDGSTYSAQPQGSIFPGAVLIPGATEDASIWVKNTSGGPAQLSVALADASATEQALLDSLTLEAAIGGSLVGEPIPLATPDECVPLVAGAVLQDGEVAEVRLRLTLSADAGNEGQGSTAGARLNVSLADAAAGVSLPADCGTESTPLPLLPDVPGSTPAGTGTSGVPVSTGTRGSDSAEVTEFAVTGTPDAAPPVSPDETEFALPTLPFAEHASPTPWVAAGAAVLGAAALLILLILKRRARSREQ